MNEVQADPIEQLRRRTSTKWATYGPEVLPMFVAEMDYPIAPAISEQLRDLITRSDLGYESRRPDLGLAFADFAQSRWGWRFDPATLRSTVNVMAAITAIARAAIEPGDRVLLNSPVYAPFFTAIEEIGAEQVDVPLVADGDSWALDLDGIEAAYRGGVKVHLLCSPHNPIGVVHSRAHLERLAELAAQFGVLVISDEIHGGLTLPGTAFVPFLDVSDAAREVGVTVTSATKAFNVPGATAAWWIPGSEVAEARYAARLPGSLVHLASHLGVHAATAGLRGAGDWLDATVATIASQRERLAELLAERLPEVVYHRPAASYLAWLDFRALGWGDDPQKRIVRDARVALTPGVHFGETGRGFARLNFACSPEQLEDAITRIAALR